MGYVVSPPSRAAWIEIWLKVIYFLMFQSPPSRAAWIEISMLQALHHQLPSRRLHGRRGLKYRRHAVAESRGRVAAFTGGVD